MQDTVTSPHGLVHKILAKGGLVLVSGFQYQVAGVLDSLKENCAFRDNLRSHSIDVWSPNAEYGQTSRYLKRQFVVVSVTVIKFSVWYTCILYL